MTDRTQLFKDWGALVAVVLASLGGAYWAGGIANRVPTKAELDTLKNLEARMKAKVDRDQSHASLCIPVGSILAKLPKGPHMDADWLVCDGSEVPSEYQALRLIVGNRLPDLRGMLLRGHNEVEPKRELIGNQDLKVDIGTAIFLQTTDYHNAGYSVHEESVTPKHQAVIWLIRAR